LSRAPGRRGTPTLPGDPELSLYPSRVGFNTRHTEALVYCTVMEQTEASKSGGWYFYLKRIRDNWVVESSTGVWSLFGGADH
jgi:hypothetical protein